MTSTIFKTIQFQIWKVLQVLITDTFCVYIFASNTV
jgi:hypothetical protein